MSPRPDERAPLPSPEADDADARERALADALREVLERATSRAVDDATLARAHALASELASLLDGPVRERWYDVDAEAPERAGAKLHYEQMSPFRGRLNPLAPPMRVALSEDGAQLVGRVRVARRYEGPPHGVHGGVVAGLFDDLLGGAQMLAPPIGVTAKLDVVYRNITPVETDLVLRAWIVDDGARHVRARATCH
ncbi:MAG: hypothetical protein KC560_21340, partial [Myxococcales bacterium]|nr:hypothetical protein [Myxococcales bacterium]